MSDSPKNKSIVLKIAVALSGCLGLLLILGIVGGLYFRTQVDSAPQLTAGDNQAIPVAVDATIEGDTFTIRSAGEGLSQFVHHGDCRNQIAGLTLQYLHFNFPNHFEARSVCADSNYVTLGQTDEAGDIVQLIGVGFANVPLKINDPIVEQLIALIQNAFAETANARPMSDAPFAARGTKLISRTQYLKMHTRAGSYREGDYVNHIVLVPGPDDQGLSILSMKRVDGDQAAAIAEQTEVLKTVIDSISFSE